jgi:hypothetical protein
MLGTERAKELCSMNEICEAIVRTRRAVRLSIKTFFLAIVLALGLVGTAQAATSITLTHNPRHTKLGIHIRGLSPCNESPTFARVTFEGPNESLMRHVFSTANLCNEEWHEVGVPDLTVIGIMEFEEELESAGLEGADGDVYISPSDRRQIPLTKYHVTVETADQSLERSLTISKNTRGGFRRRVYEGTDAFVNYCIDHNREIRSDHHRLYCIHAVRPTVTEKINWHV